MFVYRFSRLNMNSFSKRFDFWCHIPILLILLLYHNFILNFNSSWSSRCTSSNNRIWIFVLISSLWNQLRLKCRHILLMLILLVESQLLLVNFLSFEERKLWNMLIDLRNECAFQHWIFLILLSQCVYSIISLA